MGWCDCSFCFSSSRQRRGDLLGVSALDSRDVTVLSPSVPIVLPPKRQLRRQNYYQGLCPESHTSILNSRSGQYVVLSGIALKKTAYTKRMACQQVDGREREER